MNTTEIIIMALVKYGPELARSILEIMGKETVTKEDWDALFAKAQAKTYDDYVKGN